MIELRWTEAAATDLEGIADYLLEQTPEHATRTVRAIYNAPEKLVDFPGIGRPGKVEGTRELIVPSLPDVVIYTFVGQVVHIARILHGAQKWP